MVTIGPHGGPMTGRKRVLTVELPPMPADARVCRWCGGRLDSIAPGLVLCPRGCAANDRAPFGGFCEDCRREFSTGGSETKQCHECAGREHRRLTAEYADGTALPMSGFLRDEVSKEANRHAVKALRDE